MNYSYSSTGSYRKTKWVLDMAAVISGLAILAVFALSFWLPVLKTYRYILVFGLGCAMNLLTGLKRLLNYEKKSAIVLFVVAALLLILTVFCFLAS